MTDIPYNIFMWQIDSYNSVVVYAEVMVLTFTTILISMVILSFKWQQNFKHWLALEVGWTLSPILVLIAMGLPSLKMLYHNESTSTKSDLSLKISGHQWYWSYSFPEFNFMSETYPHLLGSLYRLGEVDKVVLPFGGKIRGLVTSGDVLHCWAAPALGLKLDACPGRLNYFTFLSFSPGMMLGQCSELCGAYHSWMPIFVEFSTPQLFLSWMKFQ